MKYLIQIKTLSIILLAACLTYIPNSHAKQTKPPEFSTAGFYQVNKKQREAINFNVGWRFHKGGAKGAETIRFNDKSWPVVSAPHGLELVPLDASGGVNYQGEAWYRKHFKVPGDWKNKKLFLHFEAIMGKSKIWVNGKLVKERFGGFHPIHIDISSHLHYGKKNIIAVWADNSNDPSFPPGKPQETMDFSYFGGIYRDVWLVKTNPIHFSNANAVNEVASGGVFVHVNQLTDKQATITVDSHIINDSGKTKKVTVSAVLKNKKGHPVARSNQTIQLNKSGKTSIKLTVKKPHLWTPDAPYLHDLFLGIKNSAGKTIDVQRHRVGIRTIEFKGRDGFYLNGHPYPHKLIGTNRHQDFAHIGNALPNHTHWRDAVKLREAGLRVIRNAHYPQDPAFMDACDALGLFVIVNTPGWQFWSKNPLFEKRVYQDVRGMVRRDRNHPSVFLWEPILNETHYPPHFASNVHKFTHEEYPYPGCYTACDSGAKGQEHFDVVFLHPFGGDFWGKFVPSSDEELKKRYQQRENDPRPTFTREWGDCVDTWNSHNSPSRIAAAWGEAAQLVQANHYGKPGYVYTTYDSLHHTPRRHFGGTLWHSFDHQRGYHPDPFWGGIMDAYRQPKYSYHLFKAQRDPQVKIPHLESGYFTFIAHEMTPFSGKDITVFSNCDDVRLTYNGKVIGTRSTKPTGPGMPHQIVVFKDVYQFFDDKGLSRNSKQHKVSLKVEGLVGGKVVHTETRRPARRRSQIILKADTHSAPILADGSDIVPVIAYLADKDGNIKRLTEDSIRFKVTGEGELIDDGTIGANPQKSRWGRAVALVRANHKPGKITVTASVLRHGKNQPVDAVLELTTTAPLHRMLFSETSAAVKRNTQVETSDNKDNQDVEKLRRQLQKAEKELSDLKMKEVERQQQEFEDTEKKK